MRCQKIFDKASTLMVHWRSPAQCEFQENMDVSDYLSVDHFRLLRGSSSREIKKAREPEVAKWHEIFLILFPGFPQNRLPSPCKKSTVGIPKIVN